MRIERDGRLVYSDDPKDADKIDDSQMPRTERDGKVIHEGKATKKAVTNAPETK